MGDGGAAEGNGFEMLASGIRGLADRFGDLIGLAETDADLAFAVPDDEERAEAEPTTALDDLGASVDEDDFFEQIGLVLIATAARPAISAAGSATTTASALATAAAAGTTTVVATAFRAGRTGNRRDNRGNFGHVGYHNFFGNFLFNDRVGLGGHRCDN